MDVGVIEDDCCDPEDGGRDEDDSGNGVQRARAVEVEEEAAGDEFECGGVGEDPEDGLKETAPPRLRRTMTAAHAMRRRCATCSDVKRSRKKTR